MEILGVTVTAHDMIVARVPVRYADADERLIKHQGSLEVYATSVVAHPEHGRGLYLGGPVGTGKSQALGWLTRRIIFHAKSNPWSSSTDPATGETIPMSWLKPFFVHADDLVEDLHRDRKLVQRAERCGVLLIDDLGSSYEHDYATAGIASLIERRYSDKSPLVVTSNWKPEELKKRPGWERTADRLKEMCEVLPYLGDSLRVAPETDG